MSCGGVGAEKRNMAVLSSGVSTAVRFLNTMRPKFCKGFQTSMAEKATSAEVKGCPSWNLTPLRSLKVIDVPSGEPSQEVASSGRGGPSKVASARGSITLLATKKTSLEATIAGLR